MHTMAHTIIAFADANPPLTLGIISAVFLAAILTFGRETKESS